MLIRYMGITLYLVRPIIRSWPKMKTLLIPVFVLMIGAALAQNPIEVTDRTLKIPANSEEVMYFSFAAGDQIILDFEEVDGKELKEVEVLAHPNSSKFMDYKTPKISGKKILVTKEEVCVFRFANGHMVSGRVCKVRIQRIPKSAATENFNTQVNWETRHDTTWNVYTKDVLVGYDTLKTQKTRRALVKCDTIEEMVMDKVQRAHSITNENGNQTQLSFLLPANVNSAVEEKKVIAWAYWVGVGEESNAAWQRNSNAIQKAASGAASIFLSPLGGIAAGLITTLILPTTGEDISYSLLDERQYADKSNGYEYRVWDYGKGIASYKRFVDAGRLQGRYYVLLENDNYMQGIDVNVKVSAILEHKTFRQETYTDMTVTPRYEKQIQRDPVVKSSKQPLMTK